MALTLVHTADWHLGRRFPQFPQEDARKLTRARLDVIERVLGVADQHAADAVLCAGDLFDEPQPDSDWWSGLATVLSKPRRATRPVVLLPGNHDPLLSGSIWDAAHPFRRKLPQNALVVDRDDFTLELKDGAVLHAMPCRSLSSHKDLALSLPGRSPGDERIRIGMVHGSTFDMEGHETNFPIAKDAVKQRGFDYMAIGDTHGFRLVPEDADPPTVYPGAPEPTSFDEKDPGHVALVLINRRRKASVQKVTVAQWKWDARSVEDIRDLRTLANRRDLVHHVLKLAVKMRLPPAEYDEAESILRSLIGTEASHGKVGILLLDKELELDTANIEAFFTSLPDTIRIAAERLRADQSPVGERALRHLYQLVKNDRGAG